MWASLPCLWNENCPWASKHTMNSKDSKSLSESLTFLTLGTTEPWQTLRMEILMVPIVGGALSDLCKEVGDGMHLSPSSWQQWRMYFNETSVFLYTVLCIFTSSMQGRARTLISDIGEESLCLVTDCDDNPAITFAGSATPWQGMAPLAKIAFQDLGSGTSGNLLVPGDLTRDYFPHSYSR